MVIRDMLHSCSHDKIALKAVACIGGPFEDRVRAAALLRGLDVGQSPPMLPCDRLSDGKICLRHHILGMETSEREMTKGESRFTDEGRTGQPHAEAAALHALKRPAFSKSKKERPASKGRVHKGRTRN